MVQILNKKTAPEANLDPESYVAMAGLAQEGIVGKIRDALDRKFHGQAAPELLDRFERELPRDGWLAYAYLFRELSFASQFDRLKKPLVFGPDKVKVVSFGLIGEHPERIRFQVAILDYTNADDFVIALLPKVEGERIILAKIPPAETLEKTIAAVQKRIEPEDEHYQRSGCIYEIWSEEPLMVPILNFDLLKSYEELRGRIITTPGPVKGFPIIEALQAIRFRLDERGTVLKSEAGPPAASPAREKSKPGQFIFDKPFLILLEKVDLSSVVYARPPYFALWVDNAELLVPFK